MNVNRVKYSYATKIIDEKFILPSGKVLEQTARVTFRDINKNIIERRKYGVADIKKLYTDINNGRNIDISNQYIKNFSSTKYRKIYKIKDEKYIDILNFSAYDSIFEADRLVDFSFCNFIGEKANFSTCHFGLGNLSFKNAKFGDFDVDFSNTSYSEGNNIFQYVNFGIGKVSFENARFINGNISYINTSFGDGDVNFKNVNFGNGNVNFSFSSFGNGSVMYDRCIFNGLSVDFSKVTFGAGRIYFRRVDFGNAEVSFREIEHHGSEKINFRRAKFGNRSITFEDSLFGGSDVLFDEAEFKDGSVSFLNIEANSLSFSKCLLSNYIDFRVKKCDSINLSNSIIRDIIDFKPGIAPVELKTLYLQGVRLLGKIFLSWDENKAYELIENQENTSLKEKAEQFRILKEDFRDSGNYNDEDKAYVYFKRYELKTFFTEKRKEKKINKFLYLPLVIFQKLILDLMGLYATSPIRVLISILIANVIYSFVYISFLVSKTGHISCIDEGMSFIDKFLNSFYFSSITFFTIGYGECVPTGLLKIIAPIEGFTGVFLMSYFTVAFVRKILR